MDYYNAEIEIVNSCGILRTCMSRKEYPTTPEITSALEECVTITTKLTGIPFILNLADADNKRRTNNARTPMCVFATSRRICARSLRYRK